MAETIFLWPAAAPWPVRLVLPLIACTVIGIRCQHKSSTRRRCFVSLSGRDIAPLSSLSPLECYRIASQCGERSCIDLIISSPKTPYRCTTPRRLSPRYGLESAVWPICRQMLYIWQKSSPFIIWISGWASRFVYIADPGLRIKGTCN